MDPSRHAYVQAQSKHRLYHSGASVHGVSLRPEQFRISATSLPRGAQHSWHRHGISAGGVLAWAVFAPTVGIPAGALAGEYVGASGDIGIGLGAGANVLVGGSARTVALQPVSVEGSVAVNVALGVSGLKLRPAI